MPEIPVTYQCWGCGSGETVYEETDACVPAITKWNVCPDCRAKVASKGKDKEIRR